MSIRARKRSPNIAGKPEWISNQRFQNRAAKIIGRIVFYGFAGDVFVASAACLASNAAWALADSAASASAVAIVAFSPGSRISRRFFAQLFDVSRRQFSFLRPGEHFFELVGEVGELGFFGGNDFEQLKKNDSLLVGDHVADLVRLHGKCEVAKFHLVSFE